MNQAAETVSPPDGNGDRDRARVGLVADNPRRAKRQASVRSLVVVVPQILVEDPLKVASAPDQQPVQTLLPDRTVSTVNKSVATIAEACARRNARQVTDARRGAGRSPLSSSTVRMVVADTRIPEVQKFALDAPAASAQHVELVAEHGDLDVLGVLAAEASKQRADEPTGHEAEERQGHRGIIAWPCPDCSAHTAGFLNPTTDGAKIWESWSVLAYDLDTLARLPIRRSSG